MDLGVFYCKFTHMVVSLSEIKISLAALREANCAECFRKIQIETFIICFGGVETETTKQSCEWMKPYENIYEYLL